MSDWIGAGIGALGSLAGGALSANNERKQAERNYKRSKEMMALQTGNQKSLNQQAHDLSYDMWEKTNYGAQVKKMKEAGLNVGMMYNQSGQGGTTQQASGGTASSGNSNSGSPININLGLDPLTMSKSKDLEAGAEKKGEEAKTEKEARKPKIEVLKQTVQKLASDGWLSETQADKVTKESEMMGPKLQAMRDNFDTYKKSEIAKANRAIAEKKLVESKIDLTDGQKNKLWHDIWQGWVHAGSGLIASLGFITKAINAAKKGTKMTFPDGRTIEKN